MSSSAQAPDWRVLPQIKALSNAVYHHGDDEFYYVGGAVAAILAAPDNYKFGFIDPQKIVPQLAGQGNIDPNHVASMSDEDAARPVLMITYQNGSVRIIDGYHRATRAIQRGASFIGAWILTAEQTEPFRMNADMVQRIGLISGSTTI